MSLFPETETKNSRAYKVLARAYRPVDFDGLIGQEVLVRTLSNAFRLDRIAHAFLLTGIRGIGKTTTARIIARALNCVGPESQGKPTIRPCGTCEQCSAIAADRNVDVLEMDAASRTGVGDIRELIETVQYKPVSARYKVYIIDEVHMLSNSAFNALLKTLEEPPPHVKFIFATTELRKIPVTVLSRCQRFDLKRIDGPMLAEHLANICGKEGIEASPEALMTIARAAEGSVRDALSLLDQAIAHAEGEISAEQVQRMIGLADRTRIYTLMEPLLSGDIQASLDIAHSLYHAGADPSLILHDLLDVTHFLMQGHLSPEQLDDPALAQAARQFGKRYSPELSVPVLTRAWQTLLKGVQELKTAPHPMQALDMVLIRLGFMSHLPTPERVLREITVRPTEGTRPGAGGSSAASMAGAPAPVARQDSPAPRGEVVALRAGGGAVAAMAQEMDPLPQQSLVAHSFEAAVALFEQQKEMVLFQHLRQHVALVSFQPGALRIKPCGPLPADFANRVSHCLRVWTGEPWMVALDQDAATEAATLSAQAKAAFEAQKQMLRQHPSVARVLDAFPGAEIIAIET